MISRIAAAFVLVFYIALLVDAGLEFLGLGDMTKTSWGVDALLGADELDACCRASGGRSSSRAPRSRFTVLGLVLVLAGHRRGQQPAAPRRADAAAAAAPPLVGGAA